MHLKVPRWLVQKASSEKAFKILEKINGRRLPRQELAEIEESIKEEEDSGTFSEVFSGHMRPILFIGYSCLFSAR